MRPSLDTHGAFHVRSALNAAALATIESALSDLPPGQPGLRLASLPALASMLSATGAIGRHAAAHQGPTTKAVRAILFDKSPVTNWALGWHQDRTIAVRTRIGTPGFGPWTLKSGIQHVAPPQSLLDRMLTLRIHLDPVDTDNAPLLIAPGSHRHGRIPETDVAALVARCGTHACLAERGDIWLYATPILHASNAATNPRHRRVLQLDYSSDNLPNGLEWLGV
ncbi:MULTISPECIES: phytanoyl-CoA dioxygenase family protein [Sphingobium]|uniref:phytanoyl-CoA dioxygenase family protein n=1 Tax=Sphingobium TaxID=165695 RepID=UPI000C53C349|nr:MULTISPECIES: phytanoyl-CoA dioxygenase family protein [Sphingobium]MBS46283.1 phytanoyl-CoA dioxygenase [Sphingobium sp.]MCC4255226.1 phytanoyl-CoA dioxygenase family protein [Sphingobium lactosutens]HCW61458.1 phytanoyl-CoA dioxygenase [Sphingobium sp.]|tara:strand:+ start:262 stop:930 length:669 start_codon:yes stop_codon:yes gene_type:complete